MYTFTFKGKKHQISAITFFAVFAAAICLFGFSMVGMYRLGGFTLLLISFILTSVVGINGKSYALIKNDKIRNVIA